MVMSIGTYNLIEPIIIESAEFGEPSENFYLGGHFGSIGANSYRASHHLLTLALALKYGAVQTRRSEDKVPGKFLENIFDFDKNQNTPDEYENQQKTIYPHIAPNSNRSPAIILRL